MTNKELLELAAKAAGIDVVWFDELKAFVANGTPNDEWNPLTDDGDALRLVVRLRIDVVMAADKYVSKEAMRNDPYAATRLAIVRVAAKLGKKMK